MKTVIAILATAILAAGTALPAQAANGPVRVSNDSNKCCIA
jgi:hypothetical protein